MLSGYDEGCIVTNEELLLVEFTTVDALTVYPEDKDEKEPKKVTIHQSDK